jgi:geranylgeranyl pyrophosphate synthase
LGASYPLNALAWANSVSDDKPITRARRYGERAGECRKLARLATSTETRAEYLHLAQCYEEIADAELKLANAESAKKAN